LYFHEQINDDDDDITGTGDRSEYIVDSD